jgi:2-isopropylmalate synthase
MERELVKIYDTSLRDGLRNSGIPMTLEQKLRFAQQLERLNVDAIEIGYGGPSQIEAMSRIAATLTNPIVFGLSRVNLKDVQRVLQGVERAKKPGVNIFSPVSDDFLQRAKKSRQQALDAAVAGVSYAKQYTDHVTFSAQDGSRADPAYLVAIFTAVIEVGATVVSIADSVSYAVPVQFGQLCDFVRTHLPDGNRTTVSVHCHNELGLAVANSLAAIENGARQVECTVNGIGEGAGNTPLQGVVNALKAREDVFASVRTGIAHGQLAATSQLLTEIEGAVGN